MNRSNFYKDMIKLLEETPKEKVKYKKPYITYMKYQLHWIERSQHHRKYEVIISGPCILDFD